MSFVIDASIAVAWAFEEVAAAATEARERLTGEDGLAPGLWWYEVRNALVQGERRGRSDERRTARFLRDLSRFKVVTDFSPDEAAILGLARRHRLTVYGAAYLELALREGVPLATLDSALATAARAEKAPLVGD
jgi:predicted nucleic acid-binding protein